MHCYNILLLLRAFIYFWGCTKIKGCCILALSYVQHIFNKTLPQSCAITLAHKPFILPVEVNWSWSRTCRLKMESSASIGYLAPRNFWTLLLNSFHLAYQQNQTCLKHINLLLQLPRNMLCCYSCTTLTGILANFRWQRGLVLVRSALPVAMLWVNFCTSNCIDPSIC